MPAYWFDVFTPETWQEAKERGFKVSGFSHGKYATVRRLQSGDILICYLKGHKALIGVLRVTGEPYYSNEPKIWKGHDFPARVPVEPIVVLDDDAQLDFTKYLPDLSFYDASNSKRTWARLQGSPTALVEADGIRLLTALQEAGDLHGVTVSLAPPNPISTPVGRTSSPQIDAEQPVAIASPVNRLVAEITAAQRDAGKPARFEQAIAQAFAFLGFDVRWYGQAGRTDVIADSPLGHERFRAVIDAKASGNGKVPEGQINFLAVSSHRKQADADYAVVVGERFGGGNLHKFASESSIALIDTESLIEVLRLHALTPFPAVDLRPLFATAGPVSTVVADLRQKADASERHWHLIAEIIRLIDGFSRTDPPLTPTAGNLHAVLVARALDGTGERIAPPSEQDVRDAMAYLSSRAVGILRPVEPETAGYRLMMSLRAALQRLGAVETTIRRTLTIDRQTGATNDAENIG